MTETLERLQYDVPNDVELVTTDTKVSVEQPMAGYEERFGVLVPFSDSEQRLREGVLDFSMLERIGRGMAWEHNNCADVAYYAARALGRADGDERWQMAVMAIRNSIATLRSRADDPATKHYGSDEHMLLKTVVAMCNLEESDTAVS